MLEFLSGIIGALAAGAVAKVGELGGRAVADAYSGLRALLVQKLGKSGAVQNVEDEPRSEAAQTALAEVLTNAGLAADRELVERAETLRSALAEAAAADGADIEVGHIIAEVNVLVKDLVADGRIKIGNLTAKKGDVTVANLTAGAAAPKKG
jgi:hypothetical protein